MRMTTQTVLAIVFAVVPSVALATHIPGSGEKVQYDGALTPGVASTGTIGWAAPIDGYDWYCFTATKGTPVTITATRTSGDLQMNVGVMNGVAPADGSPPFILGLNQLKGMNVSRGSTARLEVTPGGTGPFFYQWYLGSSGLTNFPIANAKSKTFTTSAINSGTPYWVRVSNACGSVDSQTATVNPQ